MNKQANQIYTAIIDAYPNARCELNYFNEYQLLIAVILSAQCTDKRVNQVTNQLFKQIKTPTDTINLGIQNLEKQIYSCGFYKEKAKNIMSTSLDLINKFNSKVPSTLSELTSLSGVGQKTANVILSEIFNVNAIAVDTHVLRTAKRLGLTTSTTPQKVQKDLTSTFKHKNLKALHHALIFHGRYCCKSQKPDCLNCRLTQFCTQKGI